MTLQTTPRRIVKACALAITLGVVSMNALAGGDAALYGPTAPKGSTFVRIYNASNQEVSGVVGSTQITEVAPLGSSDFSFMPQGSYSAKIGAQTLPVTLASDHYYTIVASSSGAPQLVEEPAFKNKQKALVRLQNLSDKPLSVKTADGKTEVIPAVNSKASGEREINPVKVTLALYQGDTKISELKPVTLERGEATVLFVTGTSGSLESNWVVKPVK